MELADALRTTGAVREFRPDPVPREVLHRVLDTARFSPSGGNVQGWRVVVVQDTITGLTPCQGSTSVLVRTLVTRWLGVE